MTQAAEDPQPLDGQVALVTGASRGIGGATALALAEAGAHVVLTARDSHALEEVEEAIHASGGRATIAPLDLTEPDSIPRLAEAVAGRWQRLDLLVLSAAYLPVLTPVAQIEMAKFTKALMTNVVATQALIAEFDPLLKRAVAARVIGLTSSVGAAPRAYWSAYGSSKAAFDNLLASYAQEVERVSRIRVAIIDPGATRTRMRAKAFPGEDPLALKPPETVAARIVQLASEGFDTVHRERIG